MSLRELIAAEIMTLVRQQPRTMEKPTVDELEKILNSDSSDAVHIEPDGSVSVTPTVTTVSAVADKVAALVERATAADTARIDWLQEQVVDILDGRVLVPVEPTPAMLNAARDWSVKVNGHGVGNDQATGCYQAMVSAARP